MDWINVKRMTPDPFVGVLCRMPEEKPTVHEGYITTNGVYRMVLRENREK